jgi:hypothetical protein
LKPKNDKNKHLSHGALQIEDDFSLKKSEGKCNNMLFHWNIRENPSCQCGAEKETNTLWNNVPSLNASKVSPNLIYLLKTP